ncbi:MAG TPA: hypothetical protein VMG58_05605 [Candidatus Sulfotelmatobacter sp.]|nr:hypothetical protein [Candidatus Sulfotelmatobacter sp.]
MVTWTPWKRVGIYLIYVRQTSGGRWDSGYTRLKGGQPETRTPSPVRSGHASADEAAEALEKYLTNL